LTPACLHPCDERPIIIMMQVVQQIGRLAKLAVAASVRVWLVCKLNGHVVCEM
jgi:hypothetical protein